MTNCSRWLACVALLLQFCCVVATDPGVVHDLKDDNFEHDTQAATGATTGDWLVKFYSKDCAKCKAAEPVFEGLARSVKRVMFGKVDVGRSSRLVRRFNVESLPHFIMLSQGKMYTFSGEATTEKLRAFATGGFKQSEGVAVPADVTLLDDINFQFQAMLKKVQALYQGAPDAVLVTFCSGLFLGIILMLLLCMIRSGATSSGPGTSRRSKARKKD